MLTLGKSSFRDDLFEAWLDILAFPAGRYEQIVGKKLAVKWMKADAANANHWTTELLNCATIVASIVAGNSIMDAGKPLPTQAEVTELVKELSENLADQTVATLQLDERKTRTLGMTFQSVKSDDLLVLLQGAVWPVVLRASTSGSDWSFIGPAYVVGEMEGQAWLDEGVSQTSKMRDFVLV